MASRLQRISPEALGGIGVFRELSLEQRHDVASLCRGRRYEIQETVLNHRDGGQDVFFIISGRVRAIIYSSAGKEISFQDLEAGSMFGELSAIDNEPRSTGIVALTESVVAVMGAEDFWYCVREHPAFAEATLRRLTELVRFLCGKVFNSTLSVPARVLAELIRRARYQGIDTEQGIAIPMPRQTELASYTGTRREAVNRVFSELQGMQLISKQQRQLLIHDLDGLETLLEDWVNH